MNKQQLQQEIEALQKQLEEKQKALAAMPEKWEPEGGEWYVECSLNCFNLPALYMPEYVAEELAAKLNSGEVEL